MENIKIPIAQSIIIDDVAWFDGSDQRHINGPARGGIPRYFHPEDVRSLNAIGKELGVKIGCSLVLGDWDKNNRLRGIPHLTNNPDGWDAASKIDTEYAEEYLRAFKESDNLDHILHGLMHSYYDDNNKLVTARQYYPSVTDEKGNVTGFKWLSPEEFENMISLFYEIYDDWGFGKRITTFVSPCGCCGKPNDEGNIEYAKILRKYGIQCWANSWMHHSERTDVVEGIVTSKGKTIVPWNAYGYNPKYIPIDKNSESIDTHICAHHANFVRFNPENNYEYVDAWANYFRERTDVFGIMLATDTREACSQALYEKHAKLTKRVNLYTVDLSAVDSIDAPVKKNEFFLSFAHGTEPKSARGAQIALYKEATDHNIYKLERDGASIIEITI